MNFGLKNICSEDLEDIVASIEYSFQIKFEEDSSQIKTLGELCDYVVNKIKLKEVDDCTNQQAFYKLREVIIKHSGLNKTMIQPNSLLKDVLPLNKRHALVKAIEADLGYKIYLLRPPYWISTVLFIFFLISLGCLFFKWQIGVVGLLSSIAGFIIAPKFGKCLTINTIRDLVKKMTSFQYIKSRRNQKTFNRSEIESTIIYIFEEHIGSFNPELNRDSKFA